MVVSVHDAAAWYMFVCMVFDIFFLRLAVLAALRGSILWILLVRGVLQYSSMWCPKHCACWEYEQYEY